MKILMVANHMDPGGITSYILALAGRMKERGIDISIASGGGLLAGSDGIPHFDIGLRTKTELGFKMLRGAMRLVSLTKSHGFQLIHVHTRTASVASQISMWITGVPYMSTAHGFFRPHLGRKIAPCWGKAVIAISQAVKKHLEDDFRINPEKIFQIYNGIDVSKIHHLLNSERSDAVLDQYGISREIPLICIIARLSSVKGHTVLLDALSRLRISFQCVCVGNGPDKDLLMCKTKELGLEGKVLFIGSYINCFELLQYAKVFVMPSWHEGLGLSLLEAQCAGVPVVATRVGGIPEAVVDGKTGILVPPGDSRALADAIEKVLVDKSLADRFGQNGRKYICENFQLDDMVEKVIKVYQSIV